MLRTSWRLGNGRVAKYSRRFKFIFPEKEVAGDGRVERKERKERRLDRATLAIWRNIRNVISFLSFELEMKFNEIPHGGNWIVSRKMMG